MKFIALFVLVSACMAQCLFAQSLSTAAQGRTLGNQQGLLYNQDQVRVRKSAKSAYGAPAPSHPAPPCPTNYLFSCGPHVQPVPCSSGGYQGAYSENIPQYTAPQYTVPQYIIPQQYAFPSYAVPVITEV